MPTASSLAPSLSRHNRRYPFSPQTDRFGRATPAFRPTIRRRSSTWARTGMCWTNFSLKAASGDGEMAVTAASARLSFARRTQTISQASPHIRRCSTLPRRSRCQCWTATRSVATFTSRSSMKAPGSSRRCRRRSPAGWCAATAPRATWRRSTSRSGTATATAWRRSTPSP